MTRENADVTFFKAIKKMKMNAVKNYPQKVFIF